MRALDDLTRRQRKLDAGGARRVRIRALRPHLGPGAVARQIREAEARNTGEQRIRGRRDTAWSIVPGPVQHFDNAFPQAIAYPLAGTARLEVELGSRTRERHRRIAGTIGNLSGPSRLAQFAIAGGPGNGLTHVGFKPREKEIQRPPSRRFRGKTRLAFRERRDRTISEHRDDGGDCNGDEHLEQGESAA